MHKKDWNDIGYKATGVIAFLLTLFAIYIVVGFNGGNYNYFWCKNYKVWVDTNDR